MCHGGEFFGEVFAPDSTTRRIWRWLYYAVLAGIFALGVYLAVDSGLLV